MKKKISKIYIILFLLCLTIVLIYVSNIANMPDSLILFEGEELNLRTIARSKN